MISVVSTVSSEPFQWGPLIVGLLCVMATCLFAFGAWIVRSINKLGVDDILGSKKAHDELMDLKLASAVLDQRVTTNEKRLTTLESFHDATLNPKGT